MVKCTVLIGLTICLAVLNACEDDGPFPMSAYAVVDPCLP
jgi:hypothetical protein